MPHRLRRLLTLAPCLALLTLAGCGSGSGGGTPDAMVPPPDAMPDAAVAPLLRNPVSLDDDALAVEALRLLGSSVAGGSKRCDACHGLTKQQLRYWRALSDTSLSSCLTDLSIADQDSARAMLDCLRETPGDTNSTYAAHKLGIYSSAVELEWFSFLVWRAYGDGADDGWEADLADLQARVGMPKGESPAYTQPELDIVAEWFARGLPLMDAALPDDPPPTECNAGISADVGAIVSELALSGWRAVNAENNILMHGCAGAATALDCLDVYPRAADTLFGAGWESLPNAKLRVLYEAPFLSSFWTRGSADGRYVAMGVDGNDPDSAIIDLAAKVVIPTSAYYDPAFFPDNSGFVFQGSRAYLCNQSVLDGPPTEITFDEPGCSSTRSVGLYEHVGAALGGGDYWSVDGQFVSDNGGHSATLGDPEARFGSRSETSLVPMIHNGTNFAPQEVIDVPAPFEGDTVISPSARMLVSRVASNSDQQLGFVVRALVATPGSGGYSVETPEIARYCLNGGKPAFSFDERWMALHHYVTDADAVDLGFTGADDPGFQAYRTEGAANLYLVDMLTGARTRVTHMAPGQYALFPYFRSDGWIYFTVRTVGATTEHIVASDAALVLESQP